MCLISKAFQCLRPPGYHCGEKVGTTEGDSNDYLVKELLNRKQNMKQDSGSADYFFNCTSVIKAVGH